jgi:hypothetical protein
LTHLVILHTLWVQFLFLGCILHPSAKNTDHLSKKSYQTTLFG